jgi:hypothetical protein
MHPLIHILFLDIDVSVDVNDADIAINVGGDAADIRKAQTVVAAAYDGKYARRIDMRHRFGHLIEGLLDIAGYNENVSGIAEIELLEEVHPSVEPVSVVESRNAAYRLGAETRSRPVRGGRVERSADEGSLVVADLSDVLAVGRLHESVDPGEGRLMAAAEQRAS